MSNLMCSEEDGFFQDLPQFFQSSQIAPLKGKKKGLKREEIEHTIK